MHKICVTNHQEDYELSADESGSIHTNRYTTQAITITLPAAVKGLYFYFVVQTYFFEEGEFELRIQPDGTDLIYDITLPGAGEYISANGVGDSIKLVADDNNTWWGMTRNGVWAAE